MSGHTYPVFFLIKPTFEPTKQIFHSHASVILVMGCEVNHIELGGLFVFLHDMLPRIPITVVE